MTGTLPIQGIRHLAWADEYGGAFWLPVALIWEEEKIDRRDFRKFYNADDDRRYWLGRFLSNFQGQPFVFYGHGWDQMQCDFQNVTVKPAVLAWHSGKPRGVSISIKRHAVYNLDSQGDHRLASGAIGLHPGQATTSIGFATRKMVSLLKLKKQ